MRRYSKAQLNAISKSYHERAVKQSRHDLMEEYGIDFDSFVRQTEYAASPTRLLTDLRFGKTVKALEEYHAEEV